MGLDVVLGALVLLAALRGWFKGFLTQAVGLAALVGSIFAAGPAGRWVQPHARHYLPTIRGDVLDRLVWWSTMVVCVVLIGGLGGWLVKLSRRRPYGPPERSRADQGAGLLLGVAKGLVVASFLVAGLQRFLPEPEKRPEIVEEQTQSSRALAWSQRYQPAERIWNTPAVQAIVAEVRRNGIEGTTATPAPATEAAPAPEPELARPGPPAGGERSEPASPKAGRRRARQAGAPDEAVQTARRGEPALSLPAVPPPVVPSPLDPGSPTFLDDVERAVDDLGIAADRESR